MSPHSLHPTPFGSDSGAADPRLAAALSTYAADRAAEAEVLEALAGARLLVPVVAVSGSAGRLRPAGNPSGRPAAGEGNTDMALALLQGTDGRTAVAAFTSVQTLAAWNPQARPVPVESARVALTALTGDASPEGPAADASNGRNSAIVVVDVAGPVSYVLEGAPLAAVASGRSLRPLYRDCAALAAIADAAQAQVGVRRAHVAAAAGVDARVLLSLEPDVGNPADVAAAVAAHLRDHSAVRDLVVRGIEFAVVPASAR